MRYFSKKFFGIGVLLGLLGLIVSKSVGGNSADPAPRAEPGSPPKKLSALPANSKSAIEQLEDWFQSAGSLNLKEGVRITRAIPSKKMAALVAELSPQDQSADKIDYLVHFWAHHHPQAALEASWKWPESTRRRTTTMAGALDLWAQQDADAAVAWLKSFEQQRHSDLAKRELIPALREAVVNGIAKTDPDKAIEVVRDHKLPGMWQHIVFERSEDWRRHLDRDSSADFILRNWEVHDSEAAQTWLASLSPSRRAEALANSGVTRQLIRRAADPLAASIEWWSSLGPPEPARSMKVRSRSAVARKGVADALMRELQLRDPNLVGEWLERFSDDSSLDRERGMFATNVAELDPESACAWIDTIHDPDRKASAEESVFSRLDYHDPELAESLFLARGWDRERIAEQRGESK